MDDPKLDGVSDDCRNSFCRDLSVCRPRITVLCLFPLCRIGVSRIAQLGSIYSVGARWQLTHLCMGSPPSHPGLSALGGDNGSTAPKRSSPDFR